MTFYLSSQGQQLVPWNENQIAEHLKAGRLSWSDYIFDEQSKEWILLMEYSPLASLFKSLVDPPKHAPKQETKTVAPIEIKNDKEWYVLKAENKYGPFAYLEVVRMLQEKSLYEFDFVWNAKLSDQWRRIAELKEFSSERIQELKQSKDNKVKDVFFRRRFARKSYGTSLLVHNSKSVWKGKAIEISPGGAGIVIDSAEFEPGQTLFLHFKVGDGVPPFNAICSIVSKQFISETEKSIKYGIKFTSISQNIQQAIKTYTDKAA